MIQQSSVWLSYAWADNQHNEVMLIAQELKNSGLTVNLDRWAIQAGSRLWEQIGSAIQDEAKCDAWVWYLTQASLTSQPCLEEYSYALDRALASRGNTFPIIGLLARNADHRLLPPGIKARLYVTLGDLDWRERIAAAVEQRPVSIVSNAIPPYVVRLHINKPESDFPNEPYSIEIFPRIETWSPFVVGIPAAEKNSVRPRIMVGAPGEVAYFGALMGSVNYESELSDGRLWLLLGADNEASANRSYYLHCHELPSDLILGVRRPEQGLFQMQNFGDRFRVAMRGASGGDDSVLP